MKFSTLALFYIDTVASLAPCTLDKYRTRSSFKGLSAEKRHSFVEAINTLNQRAEPNAWTELHDLYWKRHNTTHNTAIFLEWNRVYLFQAEQMLRKADSSLSLPYWDLATPGLLSNAVLEDLELIPALSEEWFGGEKIGNCLHLSHFTFSEEVCLERHGGPEEFTFPGPDYVRSLAKIPTFKGLVKEVLNFSPKVYSKANELLSYPFQPIDPLFLLYSAGLDKIWFDWQMHNLEKYRHILVDSNEMLAPWNITVSQIVDPITRLCYTYGNIH